jgi:hypothetical protein
MRKDRHDEANSLFLQCCESAWKENKICVPLNGTVTTNIHLRLEHTAQQQCIPHIITETNVAQTIVANVSVYSYRD